MFHFDTTILIYFNFTPCRVLAFHIKGAETRRKTSVNVLELQSVRLHNRGPASAGDQLIISYSLQVRYFGALYCEESLDNWTVWQKMAYA